MNRPNVKELLLQLMAQAGIPADKFDSTTLAELAYRLEAAKLKTYARCGSCAACYSLQGWLYLAPTGYFLRDGSRCRGQRPELEGRVCKACGHEMRVAAAAGAPASTPLWQQW